MSLSSSRQQKDWTESAFIIYQYYCCVAIEHIQHVYVAKFLLLPSKKLSQNGIKPPHKTWLWYSLFSHLNCYTPKMGHLLWDYFCLLQVYFWVQISVKKTVLRVTDYFLIKVEKGNSLWCEASAQSKLDITHLSRLQNVKKSKFSLIGVIHPHYQNRMFKSTKGYRIFSR